MTIICLVTNDLAQDQRMDRICSSLVRAGHEVTLVGRLLPTSKDLPDKPYRQHRIRCHYHKGKMFYAEYNYRLIRELRSWNYDAVCAVDLDTLLAGVRLTSSGRHKLVFDAHEWFSETPEVVNRPLIRGLWRGLAKALVPKSDARYTVAPMLARQLEEEYGVPFGTVRNLPLRRKPVTPFVPARMRPDEERNSGAAPPPVPPATTPFPQGEEENGYAISDKREVISELPDQPLLPPSTPKIRNQESRTEIRESCSHITPTQPPTPPKNYPPPTTHYPLLYQGMLNPGRGLTTVLASLTDLPDCELWLIGDGPEMEKLKKCAEDFGITDRVWFAGFRPPAELPALTEKAWLGLNLLDAVSPSYYYSLANKAFDYVQAGLPSVQMAFPEYCALQDEYGCYLLLDRLEPVRLTNLIEHLIQHPALYDKLKAAAARPAEELVWENEEARLLKLWASVE